jgi:DNA-binding LacI/PurR family transcriptional regulator
VQRADAHGARERECARPQLGPVRQVLVVLECVLVEQRLCVARAQHRELAATDPHDVFDEVVHARRRMPDISAPPRVTSIDVARRAGVSQSTVSLVLSGKARGRISARTEEAVRAAAAELGYRPNVAARALRTGVARSVALVVPDITNPFFGRVLRGAQRAAQNAGYTVVLVDLGNDRAWEAASLQALLAGPADGLLLFEADLPPGATEHAIQIEMRPGGLPVVRLDVEAGVDAALDHLQALGHRRIGHVASNFEAPTFELRRERLLARLGGTPPTVYTPFTFEDAAAAAGPLLEQDVTAVFCDDDILAGGVYLAARERGIAIPDDLSVVGFDDLDFARVLAPPLTTVAADAEGLGAAAFEALARDLVGDPPPAERVLPVALTVRESTAPPR